MINWGKILALTLKDCLVSALCDMTRKYIIKLFSNILRNTIVWSYGWVNVGLLLGQFWGFILSMLALRWANVGSLCIYKVGPTLGTLRWANVNDSVEPTLVQRRNAVWVHWTYNICVKLPSTSSSGSNWERFRTPFAESLVIFSKTHL